MKYILVFMTFIIWNKCSCKELIPNGSFEEFTTCPTSLTQLYKVKDWFNPTTNVLITTGTPDYFNAYSEDPNV